MNFNQTEEENREEFILRLMDAGWPRKEAEKEWDRIQEEEE